MNAIAFKRGCIARTARKSILLRARDLSSSRVGPDCLPSCGRARWASEPRARDKEPRTVSQNDEDDRRGDTKSSALRGASSELWKSPVFEGRDGKGRTRKKGNCRRFLAMARKLDRLRKGAGFEGSAGLPAVREEGES